MSVLRYTHTLLLGGPRRQDYVSVEMEPIQRILFLAFGIGFILLEGWDTPFQWDELAGIILGGTVAVYALLYPKFYSPYFLRFNQQGIHGKLPENRKIRWGWNQIRRLRYTPIKLEVITEQSREEIVLAHVDYRYRERILSRLMEAARRNHVETVSD